MSLALVDNTQRVLLLFGVLTMYILTVCKYLCSRSVHRELISLRSTVLGAGHVHRILEGWLCSEVDPFPFLSRGFALGKRRGRT